MNSLNFLSKKVGILPGYAVEQPLHIGLSRESGVPTKGGSVILTTEHTESTKNSPSAYSVYSVV